MMTADGFAKKKCKPNMLIRVVLGGVYSPMGSRDPVSNSAANSTG